MDESKFVIAKTSAAQKFAEHLGKLENEAELEDLMRVVEVAATGELGPECPLCGCECPLCGCECELFVTDMEEDQR